MDYFKPNKITADGLFEIMLDDNINIDKIKLVKSDLHVADNRTCNKIVVCNTNTKIISEKSLYIDKDRLYFKGRESGYGTKVKRYYLDTLLSLISMKNHRKFRALDAFNISNLLKYIDNKIADHKAELAKYEERIHHKANLELINTATLGVDVEEYILKEYEELTKLINNLTVYIEEE